MDTITVILEGLRIVLGFLMLLFVPGFALSLVIFPRFNSIGIVERLAYSTVLSIGSVIALVLFMDVVLGVDTLPVNIILGIAVFTSIVFFVWVCERWYLNSRFKKRLEPVLAADYQKIESFYTREINAARDLFREDTRTVVVYHEHQPSGLNLVDHSYLLDVGEEIDIQQVVENKVKVTESFLVPPPYPKTRYFELVIREYKENELSLVDDLQIYPVLITKKPDRIILGFVLQPGTPHITERIHTKTSTTELEWIYSHDFHLFAIIHTEDTLSQMVDRIMGKLDEITHSLRSGIHISSLTEDRQILKEEFDAVLTGKPIETPVRPREIAQQPEVQFGAELWEIPKRPEVPPEIEPKEKQRRPVILAASNSEDVLKPQEVPGGEVLIEIPRRPVMQTVPGPEEIPRRPEVLAEEPVPSVLYKRPVIQEGPEPQEIPPSPVVQTIVIPKKIPGRPFIPPWPEYNAITRPPVIETGAGQEEIPKPPDVKTAVELRDLPRHEDVPGDLEIKEIRKQPVVPTEAGTTQVPKPPEIQTGAEIKKIFRHGPARHTVERKELNQRQKDQFRVEQQEILKHQKALIGTESKAVDRRKLQKEILQDLDVHNLTPDSFEKSRRYIENIEIPKKSDVPKKLAEIEEDKDADWMDLEWLYEEEK